MDTFSTATTPFAANIATSPTAAVPPAPSPGGFTTEVSDYLTDTNPFGLQLYAAATSIANQMSDTGNVWASIAGAPSSVPSTPPTFVTTGAPSAATTTTGAPSAVTTMPEVPSAPSAASGTPSAATASSSTLPPGSGFLETPYGEVYAPGQERRLTHQAIRIAAGFESGAMSVGQAQQLEGDYAQYRNQLAADRVSGGVNGQERTQLNSTLTSISQQIYTDKHPSG